MPRASMLAFSTRWMRRAGVAAGSVFFALAAASGEPAWVSGITEPIKDVTMAFPTIGVVGARPLEEGAAVTRGQVVIELDKRLEELDAERKRLAAELIKNELERLQSLASRNTISVSREELDRKQAEREIARIEHELAVEVVRRRQIVAPVDGYVARFFKDVGEKCEEQQPVVRIVDVRRCYFVANFEPGLGRRLKLGQTVALEIETGAAPAKVRGSIRYISPIVDAASGLLRIKAVFDNPDPELRPGVAGRMLVE